MKKTLAIVLALVMVLAMIPAMSADVTENKTITDKHYSMTVLSWGDEVARVHKDDVNTITFEYDFEALKADVTGKWTEDAKMGLVQVGGFDTAFTADAKVTIDGKELKLDGYAPYKAFEKYIPENGGVVTFPVELTKAGYTDTYLVQVTETKDGKTTTETAKVSLVLKNTAAYKGAETAYITNIASTNRDVASAYIVGDKLYIDYVEETAGVAELKVTFADENKAAFSGITYAYNPVVKQADGSYKVDLNITSLSGKTDPKAEVKLDKSAAKFGFDGDADDETVKFLLETKAANYETKAYTVKLRTGIVEEDPKGIYFAETTKTIAMGETYAPVVMGVKTAKPVAAEIKVGAQTDKQVIDIDADGNVVGTREGVAYITAVYQTAGEKQTYVANAMKIVVTLPGESIPELEPAAEIYYVTCRNLNVRAGGSTSYKKVDMIHRGDAVKVLEIKNGWAKLDNGTYVCAKYIAK